MVEVFFLNRFSILTNVFKGELAAEWFFKKITLQVTASVLCFGNRSMSYDGEQELVYHLCFCCGTERVVLDVLL